ncbi:Gfo/Idh/MocA family protein [Kitasatospora aureofaciens]|uniref:Gfo/Idh/MocA family protein n=1 Tax=Kitasatospora aureofaciens TaxID=1894 RepID=UPI0037C5997D
MPEKIRWGILGTGVMATDFAEDLLRLPDAELVAVGSRTEQAARSFADRFNIPAAHGSWQDLVADDLDIIHIATPATTHYSAAALCLEAGRAVLCEKPFTIDAAESRSLLDIARRKQCFLMEGMWMRCNPSVRRIAELVSEGAIGKLRTVHADLSVAVPSDPLLRLRNPLLGGGALLDMGVYGISFTHLLLGPPDTVSAWSCLTPEGVDSHTGMILGYESGAMALLSCSILAETPASAVVQGTDGRIELPYDFTCPPSFTLHRTGRPPEVFRTPWEGHGFLYEAAEAMRCLRASAIESPLVPWQSTLDVMEVMDRARSQIGLRYPTEG